MQIRDPEILKKTNLVPIRDPEFLYQKDCFWSGIHQTTVTRLSENKFSAAFLWFQE